METAGLQDAYLDALHTYLAILNDKTAVRSSSQSIYHVGRETIENAMGDGTLSLASDYAKANPIGSASGALSTSLDFLCRAVEHCCEVSTGATVLMADGAVPGHTAFDFVLTDPPYYNAYDYAGLSDFFYVWLKRSLAMPHNQALLGLPLTPKKNQAIMASESDGNVAARAEYVQRMRLAFDSASRRCNAGLVSVVFAHTDPDAWATLFEALLAAGLSPDASWPIDTELQTGSTKAGKAKLKTSVWMVCRPRDVDAGPAFIDDIREELRREVESKLLDFWRRGIRGADFFISAIGPALAVFGRHSKVLKPDGDEVGVREFLDIVRQESTGVALQQVLGTDNLGVIDPATRAHITWAWSHGKAALEAGEAIALCLATGADLGDITRPHAIVAMTKEKSKKMAKLRSIAERAREDEELGRGNGARATPLIDELQHAAHLWGAGKAATDLPRYRAALGEERWQTLRMLGQAVEACLPAGDEDKRIINGMLGSNVASGVAPAQVPGQQSRLEL